MVSGWSSYLHQNPIPSLSPHWTLYLAKVVSQDAVKIYLELYVAAPSWAVDALKLEPVTCRKVGN